MVENIKETEENEDHVDKKEKPAKLPYFMEFPLDGEYDDRIWEVIEENYIEVAKQGEE